jgi:xylulokinase
MVLIGYDIGSSSVKACLISAETGACLAASFHPKQEMAIRAVRSGWAEQDPSAWWDNLKLATADILAASGVHPGDVKAIGISYQMHGLVCVGRDLEPLRPAIIWCDSRAVETGRQAFESIGAEKCLGHLLNSPGNFTASKLKWVKDNEPAVYGKIFKIMLPGDYIAMKMTGVPKTTMSGLSEGMLWDFKEGKPAGFLLDHYGIDTGLLPELTGTFSDQGHLTAAAAEALGLKAGTPIAYRAGDQPNNALSLNVLNPGEIAATAGTSGVVYGVSAEIKYDPQSRVNTFAHVNHQSGEPRLGVLLCLNGVGILNSWLKRNIMPDGISYQAMNDLGAQAPIGSAGLAILPFGNGAERMLGNADRGAELSGINFNIHDRRHLLRAAQEGIVFSFKYGMDIMQGIGIRPSVIRAGNANMFLSPLFRKTFASVTGASVELMETDGAIGAARGAGVGIGLYKTFKEAFVSLKSVETIEPDAKNSDRYVQAYGEWKIKLLNSIKSGKEHAR